MEASPPLALVESVRCLDCGVVYAKPLEGGTVERNPGCPTCGYVGWIPLRLSARRRAQRRFAGDRLPLRLARSR
jgi:hypothetical protein